MWKKKRVNLETGEIKNVHLCPRCGKEGAMTRGEIHFELWSDVDRRYQPASFVRWACAVCRFDWLE